ncbi:Solute carrier family 22 member 13 [Strongyloides ratti]|uniref:Solute carrier family 22 member 13 n=1 Tax=Strongyloides ratti TaxID=34506 RepID=A0A090LN68_STRRB|nr:Solute carrier family 22 member 13 [Strongyloides ratti]CEF71176.1 Solute carrier family 22 member 13 [Strongyloides ratti]
MNEISTGNINNLPYQTVNNLLQYYGPKSCYIIILYILSSTTWTLTSGVLFLPTFIIERISCGGNDVYWCNRRLNNSISMNESFPLTENDISLFSQSFFIGSIFGSIIQSYLADIYGRKIIALPCFILSSIIGFLMTCFSKFIYVLILRFIQGIIMSNANGIIFILASENAPLESHPVIALLCNLSWAMGLILLVPIAYFFPNYKEIIIITNSIVFLFSIILWFILPESIHFLFEKKQKNKIESWINKANKYSKNKLNINIDSYIKKFHSLDGEFQKGAITNTSLSKVIKYYWLNKKYFVYLFLIFFIWFNEFLSYYLFTINAKELVGNPYVNIILISLVEFPTSFLAPITISKFGRKNSMIVTFCLISILQITLTFLPNTLMCIYMFVYFSEIFPTEIRNSSVGFLLNSTYIGGIVGGSISISWNKYKFIYILSLSILSFLNVGFMYFLPNIDTEIKK